jgi:tellurite resistance protein TerB
MLKVFNAGELGKLFEDNCTKAANEFARLDLINTVAKLKGNELQADAAMKVAVIIAKADGNFAEKEKVVVGELCGALGLNPAHYIG